MDILQIAKKRRRDKSMDAMMNQMLSNFSAGLPKVTAMALGLLYTLILIDFATTIIFNFEQDWLFKVIPKKVFEYGVWIYIIKNYPTLVEIIKNGFIQIGTAVGGGDSASYLSSPETLLNAGMVKLQPVLIQKYEVGTMTEQFILFGIGILALLCYFSVAINVFLQNIIWGMFIPLFLPLLPTGVWHRTAFLSQAVISAIFSLGARFMVFAALFGFIGNFLAKIPSPKLGISEMLVYLIQVGVISVLIWILPEMASGFLAGAAPNLNANSNMARGARKIGGAAGAAAGAGAARVVDMIKSKIGGGKTTSEQVKDAAKL